MASLLVLEALHYRNFPLDLVVLLDLVLDSLQVVPLLVGLQVSLTLNLISHTPLLLEHLDGIRLVDVYRLTEGNKWNHLFDFPIGEATSYFRSLAGEGNRGILSQEYTDMFNFILVLVSILLIYSSCD